MSKHGFIFSLDAFVAFLLTMLTIGLLIFTISTPKAFYPSLEQAHAIAHDTLYALATTTDDASQGSYLEQMLSQPGRADEITSKVAGGLDGSGNTVYGIVPRGYGYKVERYIFKPETPEGAQQPWETIYDAGTDSCGIRSDRCGTAYSKLSASASVFVPLYESTPKPGESPFCYLNCQGYEYTDSSGPHYSPGCTTTPCSAAISNFDAGKNTIQMVRFTVYT